MVMVKTPKILFFSQDTKNTNLKKHHQKCKLLWPQFLLFFAALVQFMRLQKFKRASDDCLKLLERQQNSRQEYHNKLHICSLLTYFCPSSKILFF